MKQKNLTFDQLCSLCCLTWKIVHQMCMTWSCCNTEGLHYYPSHWSHVSVHFQMCENCVSIRQPFFHFRAVWNAVRVENSESTLKCSTFSTVLKYSSTHKYHTYLIVSHGLQVFFSLFCVAYIFFLSLRSRWQLQCFLCYVLLNIHSYSHSLVFSITWISFTGRIMMNRRQFYWENIITRVAN